MNTYVKEVYIPEVFDIGSTVVFIMSTGESVSYQVWDGFMSATYGANDKIFDILGIEDKYDFIKKAVGYRPDDGWFPFVRSIEDLKKIVKAFAEYRPDGMTDDKEERFTLSVNKHKPTKLNFKL